MPIAHNHSLTMLLINRHINETRTAV